MKKKIYICCAIVVGLLLAAALDGLLETWWINRQVAAGIIPMVNNDFGWDAFLPWQLTVAFFAFGLAFGTWLGLWGWRVVYVEKRHWSMRKKK